MRADTDNDGLNDKWESQYSYEEMTPAGNVTLFDPLSGNWGCLLLDAGTIQIMRDHFNGEDGRPEWESLANPSGQHSCDMVLDTDSDGLANIEEEEYGTNPTLRDSDGDLLDDIVEISNSSVGINFKTARDCGTSSISTLPKNAPFGELDTAMESL